MREVPIEVLLSFPKPNYKNPQTQGTALLVVNAVFAGLVVLVVSLRIYTRLYIKRWLGTDDILIIIATIFTLGLNAAVILANARYYWDRHIWDIPLTGLAGVGQIAMAAKALFTLASFFTRVSLLCFYSRLTADTSLTRYKWFLHAAMAFNIAVCITFVALTIFQCTPISAYWIFPATGKCIDEGKATLAAGVINCFADILITALPIPMILKLKMPLKQRLGVIILLSLGFIVTVAGSIRTYFIWKCLIDSYDETWYAYPLWICAAVEIDLAVLCACAPALRPLLITYARPLISSLESLYGSRSSNRGTGKNFGVLSSTSNPTSHTVSNLDYEMEKGPDPADIDEALEHPRVPRKLSKRKAREAREEPNQHQRLAIMERHSFEVLYEEKRNGTSQRTSTDTGFGKPQGRMETGERYHWPLPQDRPHTHHSGELRKDSMLRVPSHAPHLNAPLPISPLSESFLNTRLQMDEGQHEGSYDPSSPQDDSFYISNTSVGDEEESSKSPRSGRRVEDWPLGSISEVSTKPELRDGERRWEIGRNPFHDNSNDKAEPRVSTSAGVPSHQRWRSEPHLWTEIHNQKRSKSLQRSGSLAEHSRGVAMML